MKKVIAAIALAAAAASGGQSAHAALTVGPPDAKGFPTTVSDGAFVLDGCTTVRPGLAGGPCEAGEVLYYAMEFRTATDALSRLQLIVDFSPLVAPAAAGGKQIVNEMRLRMIPAGKNLLQEGTYNVTTPFGPFSFTIPGGVKATTKKVDILIVRNPDGTLAVGEPVPVTIPAGGFPAGTTLPIGPVDRFIPAVKAPPGFLGDMGDPAIPLSPKAAAMGPPPTGEVPLVGGGKFEVVFVDGTPTGQLIGGSDAFFVLGSVVKTINTAPAAAPDIALAVGTDKAVSMTVAPNTIATSAAAFGPQLPAPAVASTDPALAGMTVAGPAITGPFVFAAKAVPPQKIVQVAADAGSLTNPSQVTVTPVPDAVGGTADFNANTGVLLIKATTTLSKLPVKQRPTLTATVNAQTVTLNAAGTANVKLGKGAAFPGPITVTSTAGGTATITPTCKPATAAACTAPPVL